MRIATYEERLNAVIAVNPKALEEAEALDRERAQGKVRGPLHGIPIALKDNIHTTNMPTTGGALAFDGLIPAYEATLTKNLRDAGAVIIAKTVLTELANWVASGMPGNYSALGGYGMNPYDPRRDPREATGDGRPVMGTGRSTGGAEAEPQPATAKRSSARTADFNVGVLLFMTKSLLRPDELQLECHGCKKTIIHFISNG